MRDQRGGAFMNRLTGSKGYIPLLSMWVATLLLLPHIVLGATAPVTKELLTISGLSTPGLIAADNFGDMYVADIYNNVIGIYNSKGNRTGTIKPSNKVSALAVSPDNLIYASEVINHSTDGVVEVFKSDGSFVRTITGNVKLPGAMAFLSNGEMYIVSGNTVRKFDPSMNITSLVLGGNADSQGSMVAPSSLVIKEVKDPTAIDGIDRQKSELYVLDYGFISTADSSYSSSNRVWRVQVFDLNGAYLRSFSNYSFGVDGKVGSASGMALDNEGRIYISDNVQNIIVVYDGNGLPLSTMAPIANPLNISFTGDRLYIASKKSAETTRVGSAEVIGIDSFAMISESPSTLRFAYHKGAATASQSIVISNAGSAVLSWQAVFTGAQGEWLSLSQNSGQVGGNSSQTIAAAIDAAVASGLPLGTYSGQLNILSNGGTETIPVALDVVGAPVLTVTPQQFNVSKTVGDQIVPLSVTVIISNDTSGALDWTSTSDKEWLAIKKGNATSTVANSVTTTTTSAQLFINTDIIGSYTGTVKLFAADAVGSPSTITVNLEVTGSNTIHVTTNTPDATFAIYGPDAFVVNAKGKNFTIGDLKAGNYTVQYGDVKGFIKPASETLALTSGEVNFTGEYIDLRRQVNIIASESGGKNVVVFRADGSAVLNMAPISGAIGVNSASGDIDGDGMADIIVASNNAVRDGVSQAAVVSGFDALGTAISGLSFKAISPASSGVSVSTGDFNGDGKEEIAVGSSGSSSTIKIFAYSSGLVSDTGIYIAEAFSGNKGGVNVSSADIDGDGIAELVVMPIVVDIGMLPEVKVYRIDASAGVGMWRAELYRTFNGGPDGSECRLATGDIDADGLSEIISLCTKGAVSVVSEFKATGELIRAFNSGVRSNSIAMGDTDMDGTAEIILSDAPDLKTQNIRIFDANTGVTKRTFRFYSSTGVNVSAGNLGY